MGAVSAGPKAKITAEPLDFSDYPEDRAARRLKFIEDYLVTPRGHGAGEPFNVRDFQREIVEGAYAEGIRTALVSMPRGNGKTSLAAALALAEMFVGEPSAEVLVVAADLRQAGITLRLAKRMVELSPELSERCHIFRDRLEYPANDAVLEPLPADYAALQGRDATLQVVDELHVVGHDIWEAVTTAAGKRPESLTLAISTPSDSQESVMWDLISHGRNNDDPAFYLKEYAAPDGCEADDEDAWRIANPALADPEPFMALDALHSVFKTTREARWRQLRLGQWVESLDAWLPFGVFDACADETVEVAEGTKVVLGFDGSASGDSTVLIGCTVEANPHIFTVGMWERPKHSPDWRVPRAEVAETVHEAFRRWDVLCLAADPWGWRTELEEWAKEHPRRVVEWNTAHRKRMAPATDRMYQHLVEQRITHDGDERLRSHFHNAKAIRTIDGDVIVKDKKTSVRKIDGAVAAVLALDRAAFHLTKRGRVATSK